MVISLQTHFQWCRFCHVAVSVRYRTQKGRKQSESFFTPAKTATSFEQCSFAEDSMRKAWRGIVRLGMRVSGFAVRARTGEKYRVISKTHLFIAIRYIQSDKKKIRRSD
ncbi:hypothetical protein M445_24540 [Vibrio owensii 47666-1]|nr:hypothetical protein M445_24540 [Vibrio owensii 47666-1]